MASTFTANKHLELIGTGDQAGTWGAELNTAVFTLLDQCLGTQTTVALASSPVTLSTAQTQNFSILFTGILTSNVTVTVPAIGGVFLFRNSTTGDFSITIASAGAGTSQILPRSYASLFYSDATNIIDLIQPTGAFQNLAAAGTTDLGTIANGLVNVTGSGVTINSFGAAARTVQPLFTVRFNGINTITNSAAIVCPGGVNITTAANDTFLVYYAGGTVYRIVSAFLASGQALVTPSSTFVITPQTPLSGPKDSSGNPSWLPSSSGSLSITSTGLTTTPLVITATGGYGANGLVNTILSLATNQTWTATPSTTTYFGYNLTTPGVVNTTLRPVYQRGGSISTTSGQYTYDATAGQMYVGTGAGTSAVPVVFLGQATAGGSTITSALAYGYNSNFGSYVGGSTLSIVAQAYGAWGSSPTITSGNGFSGVSYDASVSGIVFTFTNALSNANYHVSWIGENFPTGGAGAGVVLNKTTTGFEVQGSSSSGQLSPRAAGNYSVVVYQRI